MGPLYINRLVSTLHVCSQSPSAERELEEKGSKRKQVGLLLRTDSAQLAQLADVLNGIGWLTSVFIVRNLQLWNIECSHKGGNCFAIWCIVRQTVE